MAHFTTRNLPHIRACLDKVGYLGHIQLALFFGTPFVPLELCTVVLL